MAVIKVNDVHKKFKVYHDKGSSLKEKILFRNRNYYEERWVLNGISFEVQKGEVLGLIGQNGCGKSTLLKLMTRIFYPDSGSIEMTGRVSSLIELGAGFHPDMSGRENIYTNASIFGLTKKEIDKRLNSIIDFSELEEFIDNPVRTYSSGMYMRLAFSVAINVDADILLIDEILAVGDANFQSKCFEKLRELKRSGVTIVIVTHDTGTIESFCEKAVWIDQGKMKVYDKAHKAVDAYLSHMNDKRIENMVNAEEKQQKTEDEILQSQEEIREIEEEIQTPEEEQVQELKFQNIEEVNLIDTNKNRFGLKYIEIENVYIKNSEQKITKILKAREDITIEIHYKVNKPLEMYVFGMGFYTLDGQCIYGNNTQLDRIEVPHISNNGVINIVFNKLPLLTGKYALNVAVVDINGTPMDFIRDYMHFNVVSEDRSSGFVSIDHNWEI